MNCERARMLIDPYSTDELDLASAIDVQQHLQDCPACAAELADLNAFRHNAASLRYSAPPDLQRLIAGSSDGVAANPAPAHRSRYRTFAIAASIAVLLLLPGFALLWNVS